MNRINRIIATILVASVLFLNACKTDKREDEEGESGEPPDLSHRLSLFNTMPEGVKVESRYTSAVDNVLNVKEAHEQALEERRRKFAKIAAEREKERQRKEAERIAEAKRLAEAKRIEAERQRKASEEKATKTQVAQALPSRASNYVGQAQTYEITHYTAYCPTGCTGVTASGYNVSNTIYYEGMRILAAPKHIPFYSIMRITYSDGSSFDGIVLDRGGDIGAGRLDILVGSRDEAYRLGRKAVQVQLIRKGR